MNAVAKTFKAGEVLFREGDPSQSLFIIQKGAISIQKTKGRDNVEVGKVQAGEVIGELTFFDRLPRSASAIAVIDVEVLEIPFKAMEQIYRRIPEYMITIVSCMADRLRRANEQLRLLQKTKS